MYTCNKISLILNLLNLNFKFICFPRMYMSTNEVGKYWGDLYGWKDIWNLRSSKRDNLAKTLTYNKFMAIKSSICHAISLSSVPPLLCSLVFPTKYVHLLLQSMTCDTFNSFWRKKGNRNLLKEFVQWHSTIA